MMAYVEAISKAVMLVGALGAIHYKKQRIKATLCTYITFLANSNIQGSFPDHIFYKTTSMKQLL